jgi:hypothetical protein
MKKSILFFAFILPCLFSFSQTDKDYSEPFKQHTGWTKVVQIRNGNTGLIEVTKKEGIKFSLYGPDRMLITKAKTLPLTLVGTKMTGYSSVPAIYEINGDVVLFVYFWSDEPGFASGLYRVVVDGKTGTLKEEKNLEAIGGNAGEHIRVVKDPDSDFYCVMISDNDQVIVNLFNPSHEIINTYRVQGRATSVDLTIKKDDYVIVCSETSEGNSSKLQLHKFTKTNTNGEKQVLQLGGNESQGTVKGKFLINPAKNNLTLMAVVHKDSQSGEKYYSVLFQSIDPSNLKLQPYQEANLKKVNDYYRETAQSKDDFNGLPEATAVNKDGSLVIVYEGKTAWTRSNIPSLYVGDLGITINTADGKTESGRTISWAANRFGEMDIALNYDDVDEGRKKLFGYEAGGGGGWSWLYNMDLVSAGETSYLMVNSTKYNYEKAENDKTEILKDIEDACAVIYSISNDGTSKKYLFGIPEGKRDGKYGNFSASDYNPKTKSYCTIVGDRKEKTQQIVWFKLE